MYLGVKLPKYTYTLSLILLLPISYRTELGFWSGLGWLYSSVERDLTVLGNWPGRALDFKYYFIQIQNWYIKSWRIRPKFRPNSQIGRGRNWNLIPGAGIPFSRDSSTIAPNSLTYMLESISIVRLHFIHAFMTLFDCLWSTLRLVKLRKLTNRPKNVDLTPYNSALSIMM